MADLTGRMIGAMQADVKTFTEIEADPSAMGQAVTVIVIAGVASLIGNFFRAGVVAGVLGLIASLLGYALFSFLVFIIGTKLMPEPTTKADFSEAFRVIGFAASPGIFNVLDDKTRIRFFSRLSPGGAGPSLLRESTRPLRAIDDEGAVLEAPIAGAAEATSSER